jgi:hypothetical protein
MKRVMLHDDVAALFRRTGSYVIGVAARTGRPVTMDMIESDLDEREGQLCVIAKDGTLFLGHSMAATRRRQTRITPWTLHSLASASGGVAVPRSGRQPESGS